MAFHRLKAVCLALCLAFCLVLPLTPPAQAGSDKEHPMIRPYPGSVLAKNMSKYQKYGSYDFYYKNPQNNRREKKKVKGEYYFLLYEVKTNSGARVRDISSLEFLENYKAAALDKGGKVVYEDQGQVVFTLPRDDGGVTWCRVAPTASLGQQYVIIVDEKGFKKSLVFGPKEMKAALDKDGKVLLYGILFDLDKATLKPESVKQLQNILALMTTYPDLRLEVQGHTDNQGSDAYNLELSRKRAETVCAYLELFGVAAQRLRPKGYGETRPVAGNDTKQGRAKNRRVELVKIQAGQTTSRQPAPQNSGLKANAPSSRPEPRQRAGTNKIDGKWAMAPNKRVKTGSISFYANSTYLMEERLQDGVGVSKKGEYKIDPNSSPPRIDICLQKCGRPGSEYTTSFGIFRFLPGQKLEIRSSPDAKYPVKFADDKTDGYTMILTRLQ